MRKALVLSALGLALVLPGAADAARFGGVVVAKDAKRQAVVVASRPTVRTVRAGRVFRRLRVGHRVAVSATRRPDGTYDQVALRPVGRAGSVRFAAIVVQQQAALRRLIVSSGGTVFAVGTGRSANNAAGGGLVAGDRVRVEDRTDASLTVRSQDGTDFTCDVPPDLDLSAFPVGTQVKLRCHRLDGKFRLGFIKSEKAVVEVPH